MKLITPPWKTAWYDDQISDRFFHEMSRSENGEVHDIESSSRWMNQIMIVVGQLAQNMDQLEKDAPHHSQIRLAFEKALKVSTMAAHLTAALDRADPNRRHTPMTARSTQAVAALPRELPALQEAPAIAPEQPMDKTQPSVAPLRQTVNGLSRRGLSVAEIEVITGQTRNQIESVLNER